MIVTQTIRKVILLFLLLVSSVSCFAEGGIKYEDISLMIRGLRSKKIEGVVYVPFYVRPKEGVNIDDAKFRMISPKKDELVLRTNHIMKIPEKDRLLEDSDMLKEGFTLIVWVPRETQDGLKFDLYPIIGIRGSKARGIDANGYPPGSTFNTGPGISSLPSKELVGYFRKQPDSIIVYLYLYGATPKDYAKHISEKNGTDNPIEMEKAISHSLRLTK